MSERLDYWGVRPACGCVTAWMSVEGSTNAEVQEFYLSMAATGREVRRWGNLSAAQSLLMHDSIQTTGDTYTDWDDDRLAQTLADIYGEDDE